MFRYHFSTEIIPSYFASQMKYYLIAGEASGDLHGSNLIRAIREKDPTAEIRCWGGDKMQAAGARLVKHYKDLAFMGFAEVVKNLPTILKNIRFCKEDILAFRPDVIVFIDYPGFNLRIAKWAKEQQFKTVFYISPQVWAWKEGRVKDIKKNIDRMLVIFPFEKTFYEKWDYKVNYVGHPLVPVVEHYIETHPQYQTEKDLVALLPGSRKQEIKAKLPIMLEATRQFPDITFIVAKAPGIETAFYNKFLQKYQNVELNEDTYSILMRSTAAVVTSGTATLETALFNVPEIICYKTGGLSYEIGKRLVKLKFICIVNLIMNKEVAKELIQYELTPDNIATNLKMILFDKDYRNTIQQDYATLKKLLANKGNASENAAEEIVQFVSKQ